MKSFQKIKATNRLDLLRGEFDENRNVYVTEKIDGSQIIISCKESIVGFSRSGKEIDESNKMFAPFFKWKEECAPTSIEIEKPWEFILFGEILSRPRHNVLSYEHTPRNGIALWAAWECFSGGAWLDYDQLCTIAYAINLDVVPLLYSGKLSGLDDSVLKRKSYLGGVEVEGVVISQINEDRKEITCRKVVNAQFKEKHLHNKADDKWTKWKKFKESLRTEARWKKAWQYLRDEQLLTGGQQDIGLMMKRVNEDILQEEKENIMEFLWKHFGKEVLRNATDGLPKWIEENKGELK